PSCGAGYAPALAGRLAASAAAAATMETVPTTTTTATATSGTATAGAAANAGLGEAGAGGAGVAVAGAAVASAAADGENDADDADARSDADAAPFFTAPLPAPDAALREVELLQLIRFFANPCRYLLRERVGLDLPESAEVLDDVEPMLPDWPGQRALAARLLPVMLADAMHAATDEVGAGAARDRLWALARAGNEYPTGALGEAALAREFDSLLAFARRQR